MGNRNYQKEMEQVIESLKGEKKRLLLHSCCAPCSSYCLEVLRKFFEITVFYYNPNISPKEEYFKRVEEQKRLIDAYNAQVKSGTAFEIAVVEGDYEPELFFECVKGFETCKEGGERCFRCYEQRLLKTALFARQEKFDFFTTTLTISPLKNAQKINEIGKRLEGTIGVSFLPSDFKKKEGYKRSIELSQIYELYRQDFCGCVFSKREREQKRREMLEREAQ